MDWYSTVKRHYDTRRYSNADVSKFVVAAKISAVQYETITGEAYEDPA